MRRFGLFLFVLLVLCVTCTHIAFAAPSISVSPQSVDEQLLTGQGSDAVITVSNTGDEVLNFSVNHVVTQQPEFREFNGPDRDNPGDVIRGFRWGRARGFYKSGIAWDQRTELMWLTTNMYIAGAHLMETSRIGVVNPVDENEIISWQTPYGEAMGAAWYKDALYVVYKDQFLLGKSDRDGNDLGIIQLDFTPTALTATDDHLLIMEAAGARSIGVFDEAMNRIGAIDNYSDFIDNQISRSICWVDDHENGNLWINTTAHVWQLSVNEQWQVTQLVQDFEWDGRTEWDGVGHDGENLWLGSVNTDEYVITDDGITESPWIEYDRSVIEVADDASVEFNIGVDAFRLDGGEWGADLHFHSNDPENPDLVMELLLTVSSAPDISVYWSRGAGFPEIIDWNSACEDLITGGNYQLELDVRNDGYQELQIANIYFDDNIISADPREFSLAHGAWQTVVLTLDAPEQPGEYEDQITFTSNDEAEIHIPVIAEFFHPPVIGFEPEVINDELATGEVASHALTISNNGQADLRYQVNCGFRPDPVRDDIQRQPRNVNVPGAAIRDDPGDVLEEFRYPFYRAAGTEGYAWDDDNGWMWSGRSGAPYLMYAMDPSEDYHLVNSFTTVNLCKDIALLNGVFYAVSNVQGTEIVMYDMDGNYHGSFETGLELDFYVSITSDPQRNLLFILGSDNVIHILTEGGEEVGVLDNYPDFTDGANSRSICWAEKHPAGQLWMVTRENIWQLEVDTDNWSIRRLVQRIRTISIFNSNAIAHDGSNLWLQDATHYYTQIIDDHTDEVTFLSCSPKTGAVQSGDQADIDISVNTTGLNDGDYNGWINIVSNDPENPLSEIPVLLNVTASPDIDVKWSTHAGYPVLVNFNLLPIEIYRDGTYQIEIDAVNNGFGNLIVSEIISGHEFIEATPQEFELNQGEHQIVTVQFRPHDTQEINTVLALVSNSEANPEFSIPVQAIVSDGPRIELGLDAIDEELFTGETSMHNLDISNTGESVLRYWIDVEPQDEPEQDLFRRNIRSVNSDAEGATLNPVVPQRDNLGDVISEFRWNRAGESNPKGAIAWDDERDWMWLGTLSGQNVIAAFDPALELEQQFEFSQERCIPMSMTWFDGVLYVGTIDPWSYPDAGLTKFDSQGNYLGLFDLPYRVGGVTSSPDRLIVINWEDQCKLMIYDANGELVEAIGDYRHLINHQWSRNLCWDPSGLGNRLWIGSTGIIRLVSFAEDWTPLECVKEFEWDGVQNFDGIGHDGQNLWLGAYQLNEYLIVDDGYHEVDWLRVYPNSGVIRPGEQEQAQMIFDAYGFRSGEYSANVQVHSNDPVENPAVVEVVLTINGAPDIELNWEFGFEEQRIDFNQYFDNLVSEELYEIPVNVVNTGTEVLNVNEISSDLEIFTFNQEQLRINPGEETQIIIMVFEEGDGDEYEGTLTIRSDDPDEAEITIDLLAVTGLNPRIEVDPNAFEIEISEAEEHELRIRNDGGADLIWRIETEWIGEPDRDVAGEEYLNKNEEFRNTRSNTRQVRSTLMSGSPVRDVPEGRLAMFQNTTGVFAEEFDYEDMLSNVEGLDYDVYTRSNDLADVDLDEYDMVWIADAMDIEWMQAWDDNIARFEEFVARGGSFYMCTTNNRNDLWEIQPIHPGGLEPVQGCWETHANVVVSPEENEFINLTGWEEGFYFETHSWFENYMCKGGYLEEDLNNIIDSDFYQVILVSSNNWMPITVVYSYGLGWCVVTTTPDRSLFCDAEIEDWGQSGDEMVQYLDLLADKRTWLSIDPINGRIEPDQEQVVTIGLNPERYDFGDYEADLHVYSNDPFDSEVVVSILVNIAESPRIEVSPGGPEAAVAVLDFGTAYPGQSVEHEIRIFNGGNSPLIIEDMNGDGDFRISQHWFPIEIEPYNRMTVPLIYAPEEPGEDNTTLLLISNSTEWDEGYPVRVVADCIEAPAISLEPDIIILDLVDDQGSAAITVSNTGPNELIFSVRPEFQVDGLPRQLGRGAEEDAGNELAVDTNPSRSVRSTKDGHLSNNSPQRDIQEGTRFALFMETRPFAYNLEGMFQMVEGLEYDLYEAAEDLAEVDLEQYDIVWLANDQPDQWLEVYNDNLDRFEEYVANGGVYYMCSGDFPRGFFPVHPGGLTSRVCYEIFAKTVMPAIDNYFLGQMNWEAGMIFGDRPYTNILGGYSWEDLRTNQNLCDVEVLAESYMQRMPLIVVYRYGDGWCVVHGLRDGNAHRFPESRIWGQTGEAMLNYLDYLSHYNRWFDWEPEEGVLNENEEMEIEITVDGSELNAGVHQAFLHFLSNDPENPDMQTVINVNVLGRPILEVEPIPNPFENSEPVEFSSTYINGGRVTSSVIFRNTGSANLIINDVRLENNFEFTTTLLPGLPIAPGESAKFEVIFQPVELGERQGELHIFTNASNIGEGDEAGHIWFELSGQAIHPPSIAIDPEPGHWFNVYAEAGVRTERAFNIRNNTPEGGFELSYRTDIEELAINRDDPGDRIPGSVEQNPCPQRDDAGDVNGRINLENLDEDFNLGMATWDTYNQWLWVTESNPPFRLTALDPAEDYAIVRQINLPERVHGLAKLNGILYAHRSNSDNVYRFDEQGNDLGSIQIPLTAFGVAAIPERDLLMFSHLGQFGYMVIIVNPRGEEVGRIENLHDFFPRAMKRLIAWVPEHSDGKLWVRDFHDVFQLAVDLDNFEATAEVQAFAVNEVRGENGAFLHDGYDLLMNIVHETQFLIIEDGIEEIYRTTIDPWKGVLQAGEDQDVSLRFDLRGMEEDEEYNANIIVSCNDPETPSVQINVRLFAGEPVNPWHFGEYTQTESHHRLSINSLLFEQEQVGNGWEIGVFTPAGILAGGTVWNNERENQFGAFGDDPETEQTEGFLPVEEMYFKVWDYDTDTEYDAEIELLRGSAFWEAEGSSEMNLSVALPYELEVSLLEGWNYISLNLIPPQEFWVVEEGPDVVLLMNGLAIDDENHHVMILKNENGDFYTPAFNHFNMIPYWNLTDGYLIKVDMDCGISWQGDLIPPDTDIPIEAGWNMIAYYPTYDLSVESPDYYGISPILEQVIIMKDEIGFFLLPEYEFSNMPPLTAGKGYQIKTTEDVVLNYPPEADEAAVALASRAGANDETILELTRTDNNMSLLVQSIAGVELSPGDRIAAYNSQNEICGIGAIDQEGRTGFAVWGDDKTTDAKDGPGEGEILLLKLLRQADNSSEMLEVKNVRYGQDVSYKAGEFKVLDVAMQPVIPEEFYLSSPYPNPFNSSTRIEFGLPVDETVRVTVYDMAGRLVTVLADENRKAGNHRLDWNAVGSSAGIYFVHLKAGSYRSVDKVVLVK